MNDPAGFREPLAVGKFRASIDDGDTEAEPVGQAGQRDRDMRSSKDEELRRPREGFEERAIATNRILLVEQVGYSGIRGRQQLTGAGRGTNVGLQHDGPLGLEGADQVAMHPGERLDQHVHLAPATQTDGPGEVIAHAVVKQAGGLTFEDGLCLLEDLAFETSAADRARDLPGLADGHARAGRPGRTPPCADHGCHRHRVAAVEPRRHFGHDIAHIQSLGQALKPRSQAVATTGVCRRTGRRFAVSSRSAPRASRLARLCAGRKSSTKGSAA